jgi:hypothetical protein
MNGYLFINCNKCSLAQWYVPVIQAFRKLRQENQEFHDSLSYVAKPCLKMKKKKKKPGAGGSRL